ncbi:MAG: hypothetical protein RL038_625 [Actinomycetota bacterium]
MGFGDEKLKTTPSQVAIGLVPVGFLVVVFFLPISLLINEVVQIGFSSSNQLSVLLESTVAISLTAGFQAVGSVVLTLLIGIPLAGLLSIYKFSGQRFLQALVLVPFVLPTLVTGLAFRGLFDELLSPGLLLLWLSHVYVNLAVVVRIVGGAWGALDQRYESIAASLNKTPVQVFRLITLPLLKPAIARAAALVFVFTFSSLGLVLLLGGSQQTLESQLLRQISLLLDFPAAAVTATFQFLISILVLAIANRFNSAKSDLGSREKTALPRAMTRVPIVYVVLLLLPLLSLFGLSVRTNTGISLQNWVSVLQDEATLDAVFASIRIASITGLLSVTIGLFVALAARSRGLQKLPLLFALPISVSSVTVGLALLLSSRSIENLLIPNFLLASIAHSLVALPFVTAVLVPAITNIDSRWYTAAAALGANSWRGQKVVLAPILDRAVPLALTLAIAISLGEFGAASFLAEANQPTLAVLLLRLATRPAAEALGMAAVLAVLLGLISLGLSMMWQSQESK